MGCVAQKKKKSMFCVRFTVLITTFVATFLQILVQYVEIKCQLDATDDFYCRYYCLLNMFRATYAHHQKLESIIQMIAACGTW
jgi:hypothetical protein